MKSAKSVLSFPLAALLLSLVACSPKVYVIDRTTVLEEEAAGAWPDLESKWKKSQVKKAPQAFHSNDSSAKQKRLTRVLESDRVEK